MVEQKCLLRPAEAGSETRSGGPMTTIDYIGLDVHKKSISFCAKAQDGRILDEGKIAAQHIDLNAWAKARPRPWVGALEGTLFTCCIYDYLNPLAQDVKCAHQEIL